MPNWCENTLKVKGKRKDLDDFQNKIRITDFLQSLIPMPNELENTQSPRRGKPNLNLIAKFGTDNWYDWKIKHWGIKWDIQLGLMTNSSRQIKYWFESAWAPPITAIENVSKIFPNLKFVLEYYEPGMGIRGKATSQNGYTEDEEL